MQIQRPITHQTKEIIKRTSVRNSNKQLRKPTNNNNQQLQNQLSKIWKSDGFGEFIYFVFVFKVGF